MTYIVRWSGHGGYMVRGVGSTRIVQAHPLSPFGALMDVGR